MSCMGEKCIEEDEATAPGAYIFSDQCLVSDLTITKSMILSDTYLHPGRSRQRELSGMGHTCYQSQYKGIRGYHLCPGEK